MNTPSSTSRPTLPLPASAIVFALGALAWIVLGALERRREAWDSPLYVTVILPLAAVVCFVAARRHTAAYGVWPIAFALGQFVGSLLVARGDLSLWPLSLVALAVFSAPSWIAAYVGARLRRARA